MIRTACAENAWALMTTKKCEVNVYIYMIESNRIYQEHRKRSGHQTTKRMDTTMTMAAYIFV